MAPPGSNLRPQHSALFSSFISQGLCIVSVLLAEIPDI
jgi:hypothetical protein